MWFSGLNEDRERFGANCVVLHRIGQLRRRVRDRGQHRFGVGDVHQHSHLLRVLAIYKRANAACAELTQDVSRFREASQWSVSVTS